MPAQGIQVDNLRAFTRQTAKTADGVDALKASMGRIGSFVITRARPMTPSKTGRLAASYRPSKTRHEAQVVSRVPYANARHWGFKAPRSARVRFDPFLWNAVLDNRSQIDAIIETELRDLARRYNG